MKRIIIFTYILAACEPGGPSSGVDSVQSTVGDTVVVESSGRPPATRIEQVEVLWQSAELENPVSMAWSGDRLVVGDPTRIHLVPVDGGGIISVGRDGEGPGEFRAIGAVGVIDGDTIIVFDVRLNRFSLFTSEGELIESFRAGPTQPFVNQTPDGEALRAVDGGIVWRARELVRTDRPSRTALLWHDIRADTSTLLGAWDDLQWADNGQFMAPVELFPSATMVVTGPGGLRAHGDGQDYCVSVVEYPDDRPRRFCRAWDRVGVGPAVRAPDVSLLGPMWEGILTTMVREQAIGDAWPSYDRLVLGEDGRLWVRVIREEDSRLHPTVLARRPDLGPTHRLWEVFDGGALSGALEVPRNFDPRVMTTDGMFGFLEMSTGEIAVGQVFLNRDLSADLEDNGV